MTLRLSSSTSANVWNLSKQSMHKLTKHTLHTTMAPATQLVLPPAHLWHAHTGFVAIDFIGKCIFPTWSIRHLSFPVSAFRELFDTAAARTCKYGVSSRCDLRFLLFAGSLLATILSMVGQYVSVFSQAKAIYRWNSNWLSIFFLSVLMLSWYVL